MREETRLVMPYTQRRARARVEIPRASRQQRKSRQAAPRDLRPAAMKRRPSPAAAFDATLKTALPVAGAALGTVERELWKKALIKLPRTNRRTPEPALKTRPRSLKALKASLRTLSAKLGTIATMLERALDPGPASRRNQRRRRRATA
jgi:hypothetical protein